MNDEQLYQRVLDKVDTMPQPQTFGLALDALRDARVRGEMLASDLDISRRTQEEMQSQLAVQAAEIERLRGELEYMRNHAIDTDDVVLARKALAQMRFSANHALNPSVE